MAYLIGTDEAGYGPNLGPLVIGATLWEVPDGWGDRDFYEALSDVVRVESQPLDNENNVAIADSKALYSPGSRLGQLERGVLPSLLVAEQLPSLPCDWREVYSSLVPECNEEMDAVPWYSSRGDSVPRDAPLNSLLALKDVLRNELARQGMRLLRLQAVACLPQRFNRSVAEWGSKGTVLSDLTLRLVRDLMERVGDGRVHIHCDKHGGRNKYNAILQDVFPDYLIEVRGESRERSDYQWGPESRRVGASFVAKGESFLPSALASMVAKYLRELAMGSFNRFWLDQIPDLKPTAGYPVDAKRFKRQILETQQQLGIPDAILWRER